MAELKTRPGKESVARFIASIKDGARRSDCEKLVEILGKVTGQPPAMWGKAVVGFGRYHYRYDSGREGDWFLAGFSPRKQNLTVYVTAGLADYGALLQSLGKFKTGVGCLYFSRLSDLHLPTLRKLVARSVKDVRARERVRA
jgi:hypothetical protein